MPAHHLERTRGVRYNKLTEEFELWCPDCERYTKGQTFWPITLEFWNPHTLQRCRACETDKHNRMEAARRTANLEAMRARNREYYLANRHILRIKDNARKAAARGTLTP